MSKEPLADDELAELERLTAAATPGPWVANIEEEAPIGGDSMIELGLPGDFPPDMYVFHDREIAPSADIKFIAAARTYMPRLIAELRRLRDIPEHWPTPRMYPVTSRSRGACSGRSRNMQDLGGIRLADIPKQFPNWLVAADRMANELLGPQEWLMRKGSGDRGLDQPTFKDWCQDPRGVVLAETTPKQIAMADDAGCRLELLRGSVTMPRAADDPRPENLSHVHSAESSWMLVYAPGLGDG